MLGGCGVDAGRMRTRLWGDPWRMLGGCRADAERMLGRDWVDAGSMLGGCWMDIRWMLDGGRMHDDWMTRPLMNDEWTMAG